MFSHRNNCSFAFPAFPIFNPWRDDPYFLCVFPFFLFFLTDESTIFFSNNYAFVFLLSFFAFKLMSWVVFRSIILYICLFHLLSFFSVLERPFSLAELMFALLLATSFFLFLFSFFGFFFSFLFCFFLFLFFCFRYDVIWCDMMRCVRNDR